MSVGVLVAIVIVTALTAQGGVLVRVVITVVVAVAKPRVPDALVASRALGLTARTPRYRYVQQPTRRCNATGVIWPTQRRIGNYCRNTSKCQGYGRWKITTSSADAPAKSCKHYLGCLYLGYCV